MIRFTKINLDKIVSHPSAYLSAILLPLLPLVYLLASFFLQWQNLNFLTEEMARIHQKSIRMQEWKKKEDGFLSWLEKADHFYIDKHLETLVFLEPEAKKMEMLLLENPQNETLKKRLHFLKEGGNRLLFSEEAIHQHNQFQETEEKQQHGIEINEEDLKRMLSLIEGITIWPYGPKESRPQLIIDDFKLVKKELPSQENVFV